MAEPTDRDESASRRESIAAGLGVALAVCPLLWDAFLAPPMGVTPDMQSVLAVFAFSLVLWLTEAVPYAVSATLAVTLLYALGVADTYPAATSGFSSTLVFFLFLVLLLGRAISTVDLDAWFASRLLSTDVTATNPVRALAANVFALALVMPSAVARTATFLPVVRRLTDAYGFDRGSDFERSSFFVLGHVNPIASMGLMTGGGMAIVTSQLIRNEVRPISWVEWAVLMLPPVAVLYGLSALTAERLCDSDGTFDGSTAATSGSDRDRPIEAASDGTFTADQRLVGAVLIGAVGLWILGSFAGVPTIVPAALAVAVLSLPGIGIITAADVQEVSWGILFVIGAMFSILDAMERTGTFTYVVDAATGAIPFGTLAHWQSVAVLLALAVVVRTLFSTGSAAIIVALPILLRLGRRLGVNGLFLALAVLLVVGSTTVFPFNTTSVLLSFDRGPLSNADVAAFGLVMATYAVFVAALSWAVYWPLVVRSLG